MVTAANIVSTIGAASGSANGATNASSKTAGTSGTAGASNNGKDDSEFAQLLDGMDGESTASAVPADVAPAKKAIANTAADTATSADAGLSAEMLAMCAIPMAPVTPTAVVTPVATSTADQTSAGKSAVDALTTATSSASSTPAATSASTAAALANAATTQVKADAKATSQTDAGNSTVVTANSDSTTTSATDATTPAIKTTADDMQWLRSAMQANGQSSNGVNAKDGKVAKQAFDGKGAADTAIAATSANDATSTTQVTDKSSLHQDLYKQLTTQTASMVAVAGSQQDDRDIKTAKADSASTATSGVALSNAATQTAGTQLTNDAQAADNTHHQLRSPVGSHQWATELGTKLTMMATKDTQSATLHMSPADLGPVKVRIDMNQNQASVWFTADQADTRSALEQSLPRLREMFASQGMSLTDAGVFGDRSRQQSSYSSPEQNNSSALRFAGDEANETISNARGISLSLLDAYA